MIYKVIFYILISLISLTSFRGDDSNIRFLSHVGIMMENGGETWKMEFGLVEQMKSLHSNISKCNLIMSQSVGKISEDKNEASDSILNAQDKQGYFVKLQKYEKQLSLLTLMLVLVLYSYCNSKYRHRSEMQNLKKIHEDDIQRLESEKQQLEYLMESNEVRQSEMIREKVKRIEELMRNLEEYEKELSVIRGVKDEDALQRASIVARFRYYATHPKLLPVDGDKWEELMSFARANLPNIFKMMKDAELSDSESKAVILVRLRFQPSEMCVLMEFSSAQATKLRKRLLTKMFGEDGSAKDFDNKIKDIF